MQLWIGWLATGLLIAQHIGSGTGSSVAICCTVIKDPLKAKASIARKLASCIHIKEAEKLVCVMERLESQISCESDAA